MSFNFESEWEGVYSCVCSVCQQLYKKKHGEALPARLNDRARAFLCQDTMKQRF